MNDRTTMANRLIPALVALALATSAAADGPRSQPRRRAKPPGPAWDKATAAAFAADAFAELSGPRPDFAGPRRPAGPAATGAGPNRSEPTADGGGFKWSAVISGDTLIDEIKELKDLVAPTVASPSTFKGGGYGEAQKAFSMLALAFGVIAAHDDDVRWKKDAATARDLFARAGFNCKVGTDQSFKESRLRVEDLEAMLEGNAPQGRPERDEDFLWSQVAARPPLMTRLEAAEKAVGAATAAPGDFARQTDAILHQAEIVAAIAQVIQQPDFEYHDDDSYRGHASRMGEAAVALREACRKKDHAAATAAATAISKACTDCHGDYR